MADIADIGPLDHPQINASTLQSVFHAAQNSGSDKISWIARDIFVSNVEAWAKDWITRWIRQYP